jgi:hypothetical protein
VGGLRRRVERLEELGPERAVLLCPECAEEFVVHGDAPLAFLAAEWARETGEGHRDTPGDIGALFEHKHDAHGFLEKRTRLPWLSREVSGFDLGGSLGT